MCAVLAGAFVLGSDIDMELKLVVVAATTGDGLRRAPEVVALAPPPAARIKSGEAFAEIERWRDEEADFAGDNHASLAFRLRMR